MTKWEEWVQVFHPTAPPTKLQPKLSVQLGVLPHWLIWHMASCVPIRFSFFFVLQNPTIPSQLCSQVEAAVHDFHVEIEKLPSNLKENRLDYYFQAISNFMTETLRLFVTQEELT